MFVKSLTLNGFKAFGDKTKIDFHPGIGALIGPNGSGKSNIIDAIKWVIGESKVSEIRGEKLEDLIFHGSEEVNQQNMAEVELVVDNSQKFLSIDFKEVSIIRRLYRSGATECFINLTACRLKDIQELFMNTGLGRGNYAVIPQGKIDQILNEKSGEKRQLFEEASSLSFLRVRRKEYEVQMEKTQLNLNQLEQIVKEEERTRDHLSRQAETSNKKLELEERLKKYQVAWLAHQLYFLQEQEQGFATRKDKIQVKSEANEKSREKLRLEIAKNEKSVGNQFDGLVKLEKTRIKKNEQLEALKREQSSFIDQQRESDRHIASMRDHLEHRDKEEKDLENKIKHITKEVMATQKAIVQKDKALQHKQKSVEKQKSEIAKLSDKIKISEKELVKQRKESQVKAAEVKKIVAYLIDDIDQLKQKLDKENIGLSRSEFVRVTQEVKSEVKAWLKSIGGNKAILEIKDGKGLRIFLKEMDVCFNNLQKYFSVTTPFYEFFFSAEGTYSKKENLEKAIVALQKSMIRIEQGLVEDRNKKVVCESLLKDIEGEIKEEGWLKEGLIKKLTEQEEESKRLRAETVRLENISKQAKIDLKLSESRIVQLADAKKANEKKIVDQEKEIQTLTTNIDDFSSHQDGFKKRLIELNQKDTALVKIISEQEQLQQRLEIEAAGVKRDIDHLYEKGREQFNIDLHQVEVKPLSNEKEVKAKMREVEVAIREIGPINVLAKTEYDQCVERLKEIYSQRSDIEQAMGDLSRLSQELLEKTEALFLDTFKSVSEHFSEIIKKLFIRGEGRLTLSEESNPLNSEIDIWVRPYGKKMQKMSLFSGGEKTLIAVSFLFSFFMHKPSPLCLLDEVDAALDSANIERFLELLKTVGQSTQLVFITHSQKTMQIFDYVYGVSIRDGKTKVLSLKL